MLQIPGAPALSAFRIAKLLSRLQELEPRVTALASRYIHFADIERPLTPAEREVLERLLTYGPRAEVAAELGGETLLIVPRAGTISPWSSKATDIAHVCGLEAVGRIERGIAYTLYAQQPLGRERLEILAAPLFDRMTEMALGEFAQAERLFGHAQPKPLSRIALAGGVSALETANRELGLALSPDEIEYLLTSFRRLGREPS